MAKGSVPRSDVVSLEAASNSSFAIDPAGILRLLCVDIDVILNLKVERGELPAQQYQFISTHLATLSEVAGCFLSLESRTYGVDGMTVVHSWIHIRDLE